MKIPAQSKKPTTKIVSGGTTIKGVTKPPRRHGGKGKS